jgi:hypothetical protein
VEYATALFAPGQHAPALVYDNSMRKLLAFLFALPLLSAAQGTLVQLPLSPLKCPGTAPAFIMWSGTAATCIPLPAGWTLSGTTLTPSAPVATPPSYAVETVSLTALAATATSVTYTTQKTPIGGFLLWYYNSASGLNNSANVSVFAGNPATFSPLPTGWTNADTITVFYRWQ